MESAQFVRERSMKKGSSLLTRTLNPYRHGLLQKMALFWCIRLSSHQTTTFFFEILMQNKREISTKAFDHSIQTNWYNGTIPEPPNPFCYRLTEVPFIPQIEEGLSTAKEKWKKLQNWCHLFSAVCALEQKYLLDASKICVFIVNYRHFLLYYRVDARIMGIVGNN